MFYYETGQETRAYVVEEAVQDLRIRGSMQLFGVGVSLSRERGIRCKDQNQALGVSNWSPGSLIEKKTK